MCGVLNSEFQVSRCLFAAGALRRGFADGGVFTAANRT